MGLLDALAALDSKKRTIARGLLDLYQNPGDTLSQWGDQMKSDLAQYGANNAQALTNADGALALENNGGLLGTTGAIKNAVVRFGGKLYEAPTHFQAIQQALKEGTVPKVNGRMSLGPTDTINLFRTHQGRLIDRDMANAWYGGGRTEDLMAAGQM